MSCGGGIDLQARDAVSAWSTGGRKVDWNWKDDIKHLQYRYPKHFEVALWQGAGLIALSFGRPTYQGTALRLDVIEARPPELGERPAVFGHIAIAYEIYAGLINAREIRIMKPINAQVRSYYESFGYQYVTRQNYLYREVL